MPVIGLDLGKSSFRALEVDRKKDVITITRAASHENPKLNFDSESKEDIDMYANALKEFIAENGFTTPNVAVGLDEKYIYMRIIKLPQMSDNDLKNAVNFESEQYIPLPLQEVTVSFQRLDVDYADKQKVNVQIVAAKKNILQKHVDVLKRSRLIPKAIEPETLALGRALGDSVDNPAGSIVLDIGFTRTVVIISYGGYVRFTRNIPIGGDVITRALQQGLSLDYNQAEEYKKTYGLDKSQADGKVYEIIKPHFDNIITEIQRAGIFFTKQMSTASIKRVIIAGGTAQMPGLLLYLATNLDYEVEVASPFKAIEIDQKVLQMDRKFLEHGPIFSTAFGLALRGL